MRGATKNKKGGKEGEKKNTGGVCNLKNRGGGGGLGRRKKYRGGGYATET